MCYSLSVQGDVLTKQRTLRAPSFRRAITGEDDGNGVLSGSRRGMTSSFVETAVLTPKTELRASFQVFHELVVLQKLVDTIKSSWGPPRDWSVLQYEELVHNTMLAQEKMGSAELEGNPIIAEAFKLRYQFEEVAENQRKLSHEDDATAEAKSPTSTASTASHSAGRRVEIPSSTPVESYFGTFERLLSSRLSPKKTGAAAAEKEEPTPITPRGATLAKYAQLYLESDERAKQPWSLDRVDGDDFCDCWKDKTECPPLEEVAIAEKITERFVADRIYTAVNDHTMVFVNPYRMLQTAKFTSIYDEEVVVTYASTLDAEKTLAPHPFAVAKMMMTRIFMGGARASGEASGVQPKGPIPHAIILSGESGSGKTELSKELLKYLVLEAEPVLTGASDAELKGKRAPSRPKIQLFTSSTKSTVQMRTEESRTLALLEAKGVGSFEIVLLDLHPERWEEMTRVSHSKRLPQLHIDGIFFGFYDKLEQLADEEQLRMYLKNPHAAKKLTMVLDSNVLLEAFGHASTSMNPNSSRFGKTTSLYLSFGYHPGQFQIRGCRIAPFLLEKSRVTSKRASSTDGVLHDTSFHIFYALVSGVNAYPNQRLLSQELHLDAARCETFVYLGRRKHTVSGAISEEETWKRDVEKWIRILEALNTMDLEHDKQKAIFKALSAILWLGNIEFESGGTGGSLKMTSTSSGNDPQDHVSSLLGLESKRQLESMLVMRRVQLTSTGESFEVKLDKGQAYHVRDALARYLYHAVFQHIVSLMNEITQPNVGSSHDGDAWRGDSMEQLNIVDVFGFEDLHRNSLDQLCINYLSEKLFAREDELVSAAYGIGASTDKSKQANDPATKNVLFLYEHPMGIFGCLEELTMLHQNENETDDQELKKNQLFIRNVYDRNAAILLEPPRPVAKKERSSRTLNSLLFAVPHSRGSITYDADEFVKKNSDFVFENVLEALAGSASDQILHLLRDGDQATAAWPEKSKALGSGSSSLVRQFRVQVNALAHQNDIGPLPFYFHCLRPNSATKPSIADKDLVLEQIRAQRLTRQVNLAGSSRSVYFPIGVPIDTVLKRYASVVKPLAGGSLHDNPEALVAQLCVLLREADDEEAVDVKVVESNVCFRSVGNVDKLERLLQEREEDAARKIEATFKMAACRRKYLAKRARRRSLAGELLEYYGPDQSAKVTKALTKYRGREDELFEKLKAKQNARLQEEQVVYEMMSELHELCLSSRGGLNVQVVNEILQDAAMRECVQQDERIVLALRDMGLNPELLQNQLADSVLRAFYEKLLVFLRLKAEQQHSSKSLEERVHEAIGHKALWMELARRSEWKQHCASIEEVGEDPEMLVFHTEDPEFVRALTSFLDTFEAELLCGGGLGDDESSDVQPANGSLDEEDVLAPHPVGEEAELMELLLTVKFDTELLSAMREDAYFVQALQNPVLASSLQQVTSVSRSVVYPA